MTKLKDLKKALHGGAGKVERFWTSPGGDVEE